MKENIIHYCWFGNKRKPEKIKNCIKSWHKYASDWQFIEWNETNVDIYKLPNFVKQAFKFKKWAFVSDYIRFLKLYEMGGVYFDTDIELLSSLTNFIANNNVKNFSGFEFNDSVGCGIMMFTKGNIILEEVLETYENLIFDPENIKEITSPKIFTSILSKHGLELNGKQQSIKGVMIFPIDFFYAFDHWERKFVLTENSFCKHLYLKSWRTTPLFVEKLRKFIFRVKHKLIH